MVGSCLEAVQHAGLTPVMVDLTSFAIIRASTHADALGMDTHAEALVDIGARVTNIAVHQGGQPKFVRVLLMGGADITEAVAERMGIALEQAEVLKQQLGIPASPTDRDAHPAGRVIETTSSSLIEEIRGSLDYYLAQPASVPLRRVVVSGGGARLGGLVQRLALSTRLPVEPASPLSHLTVGKTGLTPEQLSFVEPLVTVPVGLAMGVAS
jgi:type IV pilus assembly protein PilM